MDTVSAAIGQYFRVYCGDHQGVITVYHADLHLKTLQRLALVCMYFEKTISKISEDLCTTEGEVFDIVSGNWEFNEALSNLSFSQICQSVQATTTVDELIDLVCRPNKLWSFGVAQTTIDGVLVGKVAFRDWGPHEDFAQVKRTIKLNVRLTMKCLQLQHIEGISQYSQDMAGLFQFVGLDPPTRSFGRLRWVT